MKTKEGVGSHYSSRMLDLERDQYLRPNAMVHDGLIAMGYTFRGDSEATDRDVHMSNEAMIYYIPVLPLMW